MGHECLQLKSSVLGIFVTNMSGISVRFLGDVGQYVGFGGEMTFKFLVVILCKSEEPRGFETRHFHWICLELMSPPTIKLWPRVLK